MPRAETLFLETLILILNVSFHQIRNSGDSVTVVVQPVAELVELSRRCMAPSDLEEVDKVVVNVTDCNTLRRSASKRFKAEVSDLSLFFYSSLRANRFARLILRRPGSQSFKLLEIDHQ